MKKEKNLYYEKVKKYTYNIYDLKDYGLNIASFDTIEDLYDYITNDLKCNITIKALYNNIYYNIPVNTQYEIIRDNIQVLENLKDF